MFIQLGLRPEEMFALRRDDVNGCFLRIDEAIVQGEAAPTKSRASAAFVYIPPDLAEALQSWLISSVESPITGSFHRPARGGHLTITIIWHAT